MNNAAFDLIDGIPHYKLFIDGRWVNSSRNRLADDINPATGKYLHAPSRPVLRK